MSYREINDKPLSSKTVSSFHIPESSHNRSPNKIVSPNDTCLNFYNASFVKESHRLSRGMDKGIVRDPVPERQTHLIATIIII